MRLHNTTAETGRMTIARAKRILRARGWSWRRAAQHMGYSQSHLAQMLTGQRPLSMPAVQRIRALPQSTVHYRASGFALQPTI